MRSKRELGLIFACVTFALLATCTHGLPDYTGLPPGPYCASRYRKYECCTQEGVREDECSVPIVGTMCYCDDFCNTTANDCCPDYLSHCKGIEDIPPPAEIRTCYYNGNYHYEGIPFKDNCHTCQCSPTGRGSEVGVTCDSHPCMIEPSMIDLVNQQSARLGWQAHNHSEFWGKKLEEGITQRLGTLHPTKSVVRTGYKVRRPYDLRSIPHRFDARNKWPRWISGIKDQGWCGASWAVSAVDVASDRFAIMSKGTEVLQLSAQNLLDCNRKGQQGCSGGYLDRAWMYLRKVGLVGEECYPWTGKAEKCRLKKYMTLSDARCQPRGNSKRNQLYSLMPAYRLGNETDIMAEIVWSGPVQATMKVYADFYLYKSGVYKHSEAAEGERTGFHSVRIVGWDEERTSYGSPLKYWIVANSWGTSWGEDGYFRIARGTNECDIETYVLAAWAKTENDQ